MNEIVLSLFSPCLWLAYWRNSNRNVWMVVKARKTIFILIIIMLLVRINYLAAAEQDMSDFEDAWEERAEEVNEGGLHIMQLLPELNEYRHHSRLKISQDSLKTGWVDMVQCHTNLDAASALQIVFTRGRVRDLHISSHSKITRVWVESNTVQLEDISPGSSLCLGLKTRALRINSKEVILKNGPFMRRFLDGYYPMQVSMRVEYPAKKIRLLDIKPEGISSRTNKSGWLEIDARFEGRLTTEISFELK